MKEPDKLTSVIVLFGIVLPATVNIIFAYNTYSLQTELVEDYNMRVNSLEITCDENGVYFEQSQNTTGVYWSSRGYYCVRTAGMASDEIASTEEHEICHALIDLDYSHFCEHNESSFKYRRIDET